MIKVLDMFHHWIARRITVNTDQIVGEEGWEWPLKEEATEELGMWPIWEYVQRWQAKIAEYIATHPILEFCNGSERMPGSSRSLRWRDQDHGQDVCSGSNKGAESEV